MRPLGQGPKQPLLLTNKSKKVKVLLLSISALAALQLNYEPQHAPHTRLARTTAIWRKDTSQHLPVEKGWLISSEITEELLASPLPCCRQCALLSTSCSFCCWDAHHIASISSPYVSHFTL
ncbi:hypothetical protein GOODEAATRI_031817 [Goodea atripinnis]|uniref:Hepcidin n=1 Tax=Goodea atripinnis TaxID=208336 RepID=A0ABV0NZB8_9TELE